MSASLPSSRGDIIAANLRAELSRKGLAVYQLAAALDQHERAVRRWRNPGESEPRPENIALLAEFFGRKPEWFYVPRTQHELELIAAGREPGGAPAEAAA